MCAAAPSPLLRCERCKIVKVQTHTAGIPQAYLQRHVRDAAAPPQLREEVRQHGRAAACGAARLAPGGLAQQEADRGRPWEALVELAVGGQQLVQCCVADVQLRA